MFCLTASSTADASKQMPNSFSLSPSPPHAQKTQRTFKSKAVLPVNSVIGVALIKKVHNVVSYLCVALGFDAGEERWESLRTVSQRLSDGSRAVIVAEDDQGQLELLLLGGSATCFFNVSFF